MKGVIIDCLGKMVEEKFGSRVWKEILQEAGLKPVTMFLPVENVPDETALNIIKAAEKVTGLERKDIAVHFGSYWINKYAIQYYKAFYNVGSASEFLLNLDKVHKEMTSTLKGSEPPRFEYRWISEGVLHIKYISRRGLIDFAVGLILGVGEYFKEPLEVEIVGDNVIEVRFKN